MSSHWQDWHRAYEDPTSSLSRRLAAVQAALHDVLDASDEDPVRLLSLCAGDGRDVLGVLEGRHQGPTVDALLVDMDPALLEAARERAAAHGLEAVTCVLGDAGASETAALRAPYDVVLLCGIFGNISMRDVAVTVGAMPALLADGGTVIWTRHRREPDRTGEIRAIFASAGYREDCFVEVPDSLASVAANTLVHRVPTELPQRLFAFEGNGVDAR